MTNLSLKLAVGELPLAGRYSDNVFTIETSRVTGLESLINNQMVNLKKPVSVYLNGFNKHIFNFRNDTRTMMNFKSRTTFFRSPSIISKPD